jgi:hypothetical protein
MNASIYRFTPVLLAGLAILVAACSATGSARGGGAAAGTAAPRVGSASSGPDPATSPGQATPGQASPVTASAAAGGSADTPICAAPQLTLRIGGGFVSGHADTYYIYFKDTGGTACMLRGYPGVTAVTGPGEGASQIGADAKRTATSPVTSQLLKPGQSAQATLQFGRAGNYVSSQCHHANVLYLKIFPPGGTTAMYAGGIDEQVCAEITLPTITITTVSPDSNDPA